MLLWFNKYFSYVSRETYRKHNFLCVHFRIPLSTFLQSIPKSFYKFIQNPIFSFIRFIKIYGQNGTRSNSLSTSHMQSIIFSMDLMYKSTYNLPIKFDNSIGIADPDLGRIYPIYGGSGSRSQTASDPDPLYKLHRNL